MSVRDQQILDAVPLMIFATDLHGTVVRHNQPAAARAPFAPVGAALHDVLGTTSEAAQCTRAFAALRDPAVPMVRWEFAQSGGDDERVMLVQVTRCMDEGLHVGFVATLSDVTESHRAREALISTGLALASSIDLARVYREVAHQLQRAVRCDAYVIAVADDETLALTSVQAGGYTDSPEDVATRLRPDWLEALALGTTLVHRASATSREVTAPIISEEGVLGAITVRLSITEATYELAETQRVLGTIAAQTAAAIDRAFLVRRVEQKRRTEAIGEVAAGVAHEIGNPLNSLDIHLQLLGRKLRKLPPGDRKPLEENLATARGEIQRLDGILKQFLHAVRPTTPQRDKQDLHVLLQETLRILEQELASRKISVQLDLAESMPPASIDRGQFQQVFYNLIRNAYQSISAAEGRIVIRTRVTDYDSIISIEDNGTGISPEHMGAIFEPYRTTKSSGSGLGLLIVRRIIREHGGEIAIESEEQQGTRVLIHLPHRERPIRLLGPPEPDPVIDL